MDNQTGIPEGESLAITLVLPIEAKARLEKRRAEAELEFRRAYGDLIKRGRDEGTDREIERLMVQLVYDRFFAFAEEAVNSESDTFTVRKIVEAFFPVVVDKVFLDNHPDANKKNRNEHRGRFHDMARFIITNSPGWMEFLGVLAERSNLELESLSALAAEGAASGALGGLQAPSQTGGTEPKGGEIDGLGEDASGHPANDGTTQRRAAVDAYIEEVLHKTGKRITRTDIWKYARYKSRTEFERWERNDVKHPNRTANERFTGILIDKPHLK